MKFGLDIPIANEYSEPRVLIDVAQKAEKAGWDGLFLWDVLLHGQDFEDPVADPWISLGAIAAKTKKVKIGVFMTPMARRRPWKVARETVTLDHISGGRLIFGASLGFQKQDFEKFGEKSDASFRACLLDDGLEIVEKLWSGEQISFQSENYQLKNVKFQPKSLQKPRIPIWVAGFWPHKKPMERAAKYDGIYLGSVSGKMLSPEEISDVKKYILKHRKISEPFDIAVYGKTPDNKKNIQKIVTPYDNAGVTWWIESNDRSFDNHLKRIEFGPC